MVWTGKSRSVNTYDSRCTGKEDYMNTTITCVKNLKPWERKVLQIISGERDAHYDWKYEMWDEEVFDWQLEEINELNQMLSSDMNVSENRNNLFSYLFECRYTTDLLRILEPRFESRGFFNIEAFAIEYPFLYGPDEVSKCTHTGLYTDLEFLIIHFADIAEAQSFDVAFCLLMENFGPDEAISNKPYEMLALLKKWIDDVVYYGYWFFDSDENMKFECNVPEELKDDYDKIISVIKENL